MEKTIKDILYKHRSDFCGCYEGDMADYFPGTANEVTQEICDALVKKLTPAIEEMMLNVMHLHALYDDKHFYSKPK